METYKQALAALNQQQRRAVEQIEGPVLVIAGPGTGKTQLISTRVGYILNNTDAPADSILLLTFTEAGVEAMRERLGRLIGRAAYDVQLNTYHAFGGEIFRRYPDYFEGANLSLIEDLASDSLLRGIIAKLPYTNPLKFADNYIGEVKAFISEAKRALLTPADIAKIAADNLQTIDKLNRQAAPVLENLTRVNKKVVPAFEDLAEILNQPPAGLLPDAIRPLTDYASAELQSALDDYDATLKTTSLSAWKRRWLAKDEVGRQIMDGGRLNRRLEAAAAIYGKYEESLRQQMLYDYDDMILRAIQALESNPELKYSLAERYSYIMLDEFQDTNPAQFKLVELLTDHPVHERRPNILAVGDDDQAIYAFQGAEQGNMLAFSRHYKDVEVISLDKNYRSWPELIETGQNIASQIQGRLHHEYKGITKSLESANSNLPGKAFIDFRQFKSDAAQFGWVAREIKKLIGGGLKPSEITVLAPKHRYLAPLLPYLTGDNIPVHYERRENILDEPIIYQLERMSQLTLALADGNETLASAIWPEVLSYDFWRVPTVEIWNLNWQSRQSHEPLTAMLLNDEKHAPIAAFFLRLAAVLSSTTLEEQLDGLIGSPQAAQKLKLPINSPLYDYYFSKQSATQSALEFTKLISDLNVLRSRLKDYRHSGDSALGLRSFIEFAQGHRAANLNILNTSPYHENENAVNLLTAYGSKGREFRAVFILAALDEVWGSASRNQGYRLALPANLAHIRYQGASEDERLRLLFVAATRAVDKLYFCSYSQDLAGKAYTPLKYLSVEESDETSRSLILPAKFQKIKLDKIMSLPASEAVNYWQARHLPPLEPRLKQVLQPALKRYQLSATHLNSFTDIVSAGPDYFFMQCLLGFPSAPSLTATFGTAIHNSLRSAGNILLSEGSMPDIDRLYEIFTAQIQRVELPADELANLSERGRAALKNWLSQNGGQLKKTDRFEYDFSSEGVLVANARLGGRIDRIAVDEKIKQITVYDYKTGQSYSRWQNGVIKLHKFRQQLLVYKLLIEGSARFKGYTVTKGIVEFVEPDESGKLNSLELDYESDDVQAMSRLIMAVWRHIQDLDFPDVSSYPPSLKGIRAFEADLIKTN